MKKIFLLLLLSAPSVVMAMRQSNVLADKELANLMTVVGQQYELIKQLSSEKKEKEAEIKELRAERIGLIQDNVDYKSLLLQKQCLEKELHNLQLRLLKTESQRADLLVEMQAVEPVLKQASIACEQIKKEVQSNKYVERIRQENQTIREYNRILGERYLQAECIRAESLRYVAAYQKCIKEQEDELGTLRNQVEQNNRDLGLLENELETEKKLHRDSNEQALKYTAKLEKKFFVRYPVLGPLVLAVSSVAAYKLAEHVWSEHKKGRSLQQQLRETPQTIRSFLQDLALRKQKRYEQHTV